MSNSVLCAVDISNKNDDVSVLKRAAQIAALDNAQLDVITVVPDYGLSVVAGYFDEGHHEQMVAEAKEALVAMVTDTLGADKNSSVRHVVATGNAYEQVLNLAEQAKSSLIVVGAHKADFKDYLLGPNASRIVRHSNCSVYVVR